MAAMFLPPPKRFCMANWGLMNSMNSSSSVPLRRASNFSARGSATIGKWVDDGLTNHIVAELIANQHRKRTLPFIVDSSQGSDDLLSLVGRAELYALFDDVACELVPREVHKLRGH